MSPSVRRIGDRGWLVLIGGGEFSFEETELADAAWLLKLGPSSDDGGPKVGFLPAASGSEDYAKHFGVYLDEYFEVASEPLPIYRARDARRGKNAQRIEEFDGVYLGGGVADQLVDALAGTPCLDSLAAVLGRGGAVVAIAAAAQAFGHSVRSLFGGKMIRGFDWLEGGVVEANFDPPGSRPHFDRRLRRLMEQDGVAWGVGLPAGSALLLGPDGSWQIQGRAWWLGDPAGELIELESEAPELAERKI